MGKRGYSFGHPISRKDWGRYISCGNWEEAPELFGGMYSGMNSGRNRDHSSVQEKDMAKRSGTADGREGFSGYRHYFGIHIRSCGRAFADEVDKNSMLRLLIAETVRWQICIADYVLVDNELHLLICKENTAKDRNAFFRWYEYTLSEFAGSLEAKYKVYYMTKHGRSCIFLTDGLISRYSDSGKALEACCRMHCLPVLQKSVPDIREYWFSGYNALRGRFAWNFMDPTGLLMDLGSCPQTAVRKYDQAMREHMADLFHR